MNHVRELPIVPPPDDTRDHVAEEVYSTLVAVSSPMPATLDLRPKLGPVRDQGTTSTCAAQVAACIKEYQELHDTGHASHFSPQFVYYHRANAPSAGMHGRDVMRILHTIGTPSEASYRFGSQGAPSASVIQEAGEYKIAEYARVQTMSALKTALREDGPCYIAFPVYNHGLRMWKPAVGEQRIGGHAMTVVGYTKAGFIIRNSWGTDWGADGYCTYRYEDFGAHWDIWTTVDREGSRRPPPPPKRMRLCCITI